jgi:hypothetical protein
MVACGDADNGGSPTNPAESNDAPVGTAGTTTATKSSANIRQLTQRFTMPGAIGPTQSWTERTNGLCGNSCANGPRHMYSTAFGDTLLVSWMAVDPSDPRKQYGNVATFKVSSSGGFTLINNVSFKDKCEATYGIAAKHDGSVIAVLCRGITGSTALLPNTQNLLATRRTPNCKEDWEGRCYPIGNYSGQDSALYVLEYTGGQVTAQPSSTVLVNHSVGGWKFGHHELMFNAAEDTYFVHLKVTAGPTATNRHEGLTHFALRRGSPFKYVRVTDEWSCGTGHVLANRMAYNASNDTWSELCMLDACPNPSQYSNGRCNSISFYTVPGVTKTPSAVKYEGEYALELDMTSDWEMPGGISSLLSLGKDGFLALAAGPGYTSVAKKPDTIGLLTIPPTVPALKQRAVTQQVPQFQNGMRVGDQTVRRYQWNWLYLPEPDPALKREKRAGMAAMAYFSGAGEDSTRLLVGWSPTIVFQGIAAEYVVSEMDRSGRLRGAPFRLQTAGWGEDNRWTTMPNSGCVVFPFSWVGAAPGGAYPIEGTAASSIPSSLYMTSLCPATSTQPPLAATPAAKTDAQRWPPAP